MIKAIIFDYFGVLNNDGFWKLNGEDPNAHPSSRFHAFADKVNSAEISWEDFIVELAKITSTPVKKVNEMYENSTLNEELLEFIKQNKADFKMALLSNANGVFLRRKLKEYDIEKNFDLITISSEIGKLKPDSEIFEYTINNLGLEPEECLYVDDQIHYVKVAQSLGLNAIHYNNNTDLKVALKKYGVEF